MHILTKIFTVLVSLLAVLFVPLVVVYAHNEDNYKTKWQQQVSVAAAARADREQLEAHSAGEIGRMTSVVNEHESTIATMRELGVQTEATIRRLESQLAAEQSMKAETQANLATLAAALQSAQQVTDGLIGEVRGLRTDVLALERQKVELDDALRDVGGQLEVAVQARRALQEELQRMKDEIAVARGQIGQAIAQGYDPNRDVRAGLQDGIAPSLNLDSRVVNVRRTNEEVLAEIDAGSRDGVKVGWIMTLGRGADFKGKLRVISVDINRATGIVTLEDEAGGRVVQVGDEATARAGRD
ncbi:MAG: hypothetical protein ACYTGR_18110 [Planctomycetota bacterium]